MMTVLSLETERYKVGSRSASHASTWWRVAMAIKCQRVLRHLKERKCLGEIQQIEFIQGEMRDCFQIIAQQILSSEINLSK